MEDNFAIRKIHVYDSGGDDNRTIIVYSKKELREEVSKLKSLGYTKYNEREFPSCVYEIR